MYELLRSLDYEISEDHKLIGYVEYDKIRDAIFSFFDNRKTSADDTLLFYYSGHGIPIRKATHVLHHLKPITTHQSKRVFHLMN